MITSLELINEDSIELKEEPIIVEDYIPSFELLMRVNIENENGTLYHVFCEPNAKRNEESRIKFIALNNFPDCIFFKYNEMENIIDCYICELKKKPSNQLTKLKKQLFSGLMHCKALFSILDLDINQINFKFPVYLLEDNNVEVQYNKLVGRPKKVTPGKEVTDPSDYENWKQNRLIFSKGDYSYNIDIDKYQLNKETDKLFTYVHKI
ncbi:hypothetical protein [Metabacillus litoralis]|uniref:hypothetical protein n=1 Tax=Metabacillus litoralis TaxID=152268 RepID=UPI001CFD1148|nr:hypothetical protein [Metabacillus litoralis]